ncbi:DUF3159 domain-containing protein [Mycobacterium deserti]|uniref:DUF3159 domain-containing protein n=1 Tax=Mycobacterium deserti TaxID=2978347 RepID=A0ABT2MCF9_9MYCO|nr:DUF3159 domain-containing protein [Mycobacterium deserti]MCT7658800.1 DUF3159 domain-containing protein [Mycobacterium deserti]
MTETPFDALLVRAGGVRGLVSSALPVAVFGVVSALSDLTPAIIAAVGAGSVVLIWQLARRESVRPAVLGFIGVVVCAAFAFVTGQAKDFYLPGIWMYLALAVVFTTSVLVRRPIIGVLWAWVTGRDDTWRRTPRVRRAFDAVTAVMAVVSWSRFLVQYYLYDTNQAGLLAVARIAMGWPIFVVTTTLIYLTIRMAIRALPRPSASH